MIAVLPKRRNKGKSGALKGGKEKPFGTAGTACAKAG